MEHLIGIAMVYGVVVYMWFVGPPEDKYGRILPKAYGIALVLMTFFIVGIILIIV